MAWRAWSSVKTSKMLGRGGGGTTLGARPSRSAQASGRGDERMGWSLGKDTTHAGHVRGDEGSGQKDADVHYGDSLPAGKDTHRMRARGRARTVWRSAMPVV